jgi:DNA-binding response OmpR family regulator
MQISGQLCFQDGKKSAMLRGMSRRPRVLIVEDDADLRRMFRQALVFGGFEVQEAGDGLQALRSLDADPPDVMVLDLALPLVSGYGVRQEVASQAHLRQIPVVVVTGQPGPHHGLDAACLLQKPVAPEKLIDVVRSCIASGSASLG